MKLIYYDEQYALVVELTNDYSWIEDLVDEDRFHYQRCKG
jgi:hypothetical protein